MSEQYVNLKRCPFCGGKPKYPKTYSENGGMDGHYNNWIISCSECGATLTYPADGFYGRKFDKTPDTIIAKWNRRDLKETLNAENIDWSSIEERLNTVNEVQLDEF